MHAFFWLGLVIIGAGWLLGFFVAPTHAEQGEVVRIIYLHVPAAWLALQIYVYIAVLSAIFLIWRVKITAILAFSASKIGIVFTIIALLTGMIWGAPTWNTIWNTDDVRLTAVAILLFQYIGLVVLYYLIPDKQTASRAFALMALVGVVLVPVIRYSVHFNQAGVHQNALGNVDVWVWISLLVSALGFILFSIGVGLNYARTELLQRERNKRWVQQLVQ